MLERASALAADVLRLQDAARDLEERIEARAQERQQIHVRREELLGSIAAGERTLDEDIRALDSMREELRAADDAAAVLRARVDAQDVVIRDARRALEEIRGEAGALEITRANHVAAMSFVRLQQDNLANPNPAWLIKVFEYSHPTLGERIEFANTYRPWEHGEPLVYESHFK